LETEKRNKYIKVETKNFQLIIWYQKKKRVNQFDLLLFYCIRPDDGL